MKTQWMIVGGVVLALAAVAPWGVGYYTEQQWRGVEAGFNDAQSLLRLETRDYDRGYMNARVRGAITFTAPENGEQHSFDYEARVSHGVTGSLMAFSTAGDMGEEAQKFFPDEKPRLILETHIWGSATVEMTVPEVDLTDEETGETLNMSRAHGRADIGSAGSDLDIQVDWPGMSVSGPGTAIVVQDFRMDQSLEHLTGDLWLGGGTVTLASLRIEAPAEPTLSFNGLTLTSQSDTSADGKRLNGDSSIRLERLEANGMGTGPHEIQIRFDGLDVAGLEEISAAVNDMQQASIASSVDADPQATMQQQMQSFQRVSAAMLGMAAEGFSFGFPKIDLSTPQGPIKGEISISHPELSEDDKSQSMMVMQGLTGRFDLSMPAMLVSDNPDFAMQVAPLIKQGMVVQEGDVLRMAGTLDDMALNINGNVLPLPPLF